MNKKISKILFICIIATFSILSIMHIAQCGGDIIKCNGASMFLNQVITLNEQQINGIAFIEFMLITVILYLSLIKNDDNAKSLFIFIAIISVLAAVILPNNSSDVYYYMASGRLDAKYNMNPYNDVFKNNQAQHMDDNIVATSPALNTNFLYGALWAMICKALSAFPTNSAIVMLYIYKLANVIIHLINCYLIYKISKKTKDVIIYGLNPLILFEGIINCHNDIYVVFFILLAIYLKKQKKIGLAVGTVALGALIKYIPILILPYIIFDEDIKKIDVKKTIIYAIETIAIFFEISILVIGSVKGVLTFTQQAEVLANSLYLILKMNGIQISLIHKVAMAAFAVIYIISVIKSNKPKTYKNIFILFLLIVISNFRTWYIIWLFALIPILEDKDKNTVIALSIIGEFANVVMYRFGEGYIHGVKYFYSVIITMIIYIVITKFEIIKKLKGKFNEKTSIN